MTTTHCQNNQRDGNFDHMADDYDEKAATIWKYQDDVVQAIKDRLPASKNKTQTLLEFGCGTGNILLSLAPHLEHAYGVDISANMLAKAQEKIVKSSIWNATVQQMDLSTQQQLLDSQYPEKYDWVVCCMTLHHLPDPMAKLELFTKLLKRDGTLVIVEFGASAGTGMGHSHAHHQHSHYGHAEPRTEHPGHRHETPSPDHPENPHDQSHSHAHHGHSHALNATATQPSREELKDKYGIFSDGFSVKALQTALKNLGLSRCDVLELPPTEGLKEQHPFYGCPVVILFAATLQVTNNISSL